MIAPGTHRGAGGYVEIIRMGQPVIVGILDWRLDYQDAGSPESWHGQVVTTELTHTEAANQIGTHAEAVFSSDLAEVGRTLRGRIHIDRADYGDPRGPVIGFVGVGPLDDLTG